MEVGHPADNEADRQENGNGNPNIVQRMHSVENEDNEAHGIEGTHDGAQKSRRGAEPESPEDDRDHKEWKDASVLRAIRNQRG